MMIVIIIILMIIVIIIIKTTTMIMIRMMITLFSQESVSSTSTVLPICITPAVPVTHLQSGKCGIMFCQKRLVPGWD